MSYVVLARKWRPAQFADIVGQGPIVRTLMNAIRSKRIHQAYLLTGSRGIGKTSIARILAKAVRCDSVNWIENNTGGWLNSCDKCSSCKEITTGNSVDVIEIDGASNNGVDAVREIRENAKFLPSAGSRKIYIIDEVHMLTTAAFNALLKTLEEPPAHVIFIFATTEPHKIPATILSRCQRFDLRRVTVSQIQTRVAEVIKAEGIEAEPGAISLIASAAEGSMRDALSLLDQVMAFAGNNITVRAVRDSVGLIENEVLFGILRSVFAKKPIDAVRLVDQAYQQGHDLRVLTRSLLEILHSLVLLKIGATAEALVNFPEEERKELSSIVELRCLEEIELIFQVLHYGLDWVARSPRPRTVLDVLLVKCAAAETLVSIGETRAENQTSRPTDPKPVESRQAAPKPATNANQTWEGFISHVRQKRQLLATLLEHANCESLPSSLTIAYGPKENYYKDQVQSRNYTDQLSALAKEYFCRAIPIKIEASQSVESIATKRDRERREKETAAKQAAEKHPIISEAKSLFGGELGPIELVDPSSERSGE